MAESPELDPIPVAEPEADEARTLLDELLPRLDADDECALWTAVSSDHTEALNDRIEWENSLARWDRQYHGVLPTKTYPWPGCSNFHVPLTMLGVETLKPRLIASVIGSEPMVMAKPTESMDEVRRDKTELFLNWQLRNQLNIAPLVAESAHSFLIPGVVFAKILWRVDRRRIKALRRFPLSTPTSDIFRALFGPDVPEEIPEQVGGVFETEIRTHNGAPRKVRVKLKATAHELLALVERDEILFEGPRPELIKPEDVIVPVNGDQNIQRLPFIQHRQYLFESDLRRMVAAGRLYADRVDELINQVQGIGETSLDSAEVQMQRRELEGTESQAATDVRNLQYEIIEDYRCYDLDGDGLDEEIVVWISRNLPDKILGYDYLDNMCAHSLRPWVVGRYLALPGMFYGPSFAEIIRGVQEEINTMHNQRVDFGTLTNAPRFFYRASSTTIPGAIRTRPGDGVPVDDPQRDIFIPNWNGSPAFGQAEEALLYQYFERLTGLADLVLGRQPNRVGATRTAQGTNALLSEAGLRFETSMRAFQSFWVEIFEHILALDAQYLTPGVEFRVTGRLPEILRINDRSELTGKFDLVLTGNTETMNRQVMREDATVKLNAALNPIALQLGIIGKKGLVRLYRNFYRSYGEIDPDLVVEPLGELMVYTPEQELQIWVDGQDVAPSPMENLPQHLEAHMGQAQDPQVQAMLGPEGLRRLQMHLSKTMQLAQMKAAAAQLGPKGGSGGMVGPQALNAEQGRSGPETPTPKANEGKSNGAY